MVIEPKQRAHPPLLAAGDASKLKTDYIPYGRRFHARSAAGSFKSGSSKNRIHRNIFIVLILTEVVNLLLAKRL